jgi:hypothetical protein
MKCETCKFFIETNSGKGQCVRYPPIKTTHTTDGDIVVVFPVTLTYIWCGEYSEKL